MFSSPARTTAKGLPSPPRKAPRGKAPRSPPQAGSKKKTKGKGKLRPIPGNEITAIAKGPRDAQYRVQHSDVRLMNAFI